MLERTVRGYVILTNSVVKDVISGSGLSAYRMNCVLVRKLNYYRIRPRRNIFYPYKTVNLLQSFFNVVPEAVYVRTLLTKPENWK